MRTAAVTGDWAAAVRNCMFIPGTIWFCIAGTGFTEIEILYSDYYGCDLKSFEIIYVMKYTEAFSGKYDREKQRGGKSNED